jgi:carboxymethylenebutenolidase
MPQRDVSITTPDGTLGASLHTPDGAGPWPAVIMYPDAGGVRPTFHDMAQRLADLGYAVLLPDPYYRLGEIAPFDMKNVFNDEAERTRLMKLVGSVTKANATMDTEAELAWLAEQPEVSSAKVGTTGYCMGGGMALNAAGRFPDRVGAAASFHGGQIASTASDSPHLLTEADVDHTLVTYPALHGFAVPDNPTYDEAAATRHWEALEELYGSALTPA